VALLVALAIPAGAQARRTLHPGDHGRAVVSLQHALHLHADGVFGPGTKRAVKRFQRSHHLHADGVVGAATWRAIVRRGSSAAGGKAARPSSVRLLQRRLGIAADGVFGAGTKRALKRFQRAHGMTADGIAGPATWAALGVSGHHPILKMRGQTRSAGSVSGLLAVGVAAANRIARYPYRYGGGHSSFHDSGYDCSGSVSYVLHAMGRLASPLDSTALMSYGAAGPGRWVTIYANSGHTYMTINGRRFDTSAQWQGGSRWSLFDRSSAGYVVRHPPGL
jgi:peptidoglycan hydrolase-like protein with peptidoglycan-binding domain/predicted heme/steroid binding protein